MSEIGGSHRTCNVSSHGVVRIRRAFSLLPQEESRQKINKLSHWPGTPRAISTLRAASPLFAIFRHSQTISGLRRQNA